MRQRIVRRNEEGSALIEGTLVMPFILIVVVPTLLQFGLWYHANTAAKVAARQGAVAASYPEVPPAEGEVVALAFVEQQASRMLRNPTASVAVAGEYVRVDVRGQAVRLVPFVSLDVGGSAEAVVERFRSETER
ncbi:MAG TPA: TadE family protein [Acidimicrobiales bacterium]|nr:TadE family protein [Acidimicrobiales bacterium]